MFSPRRTLGTAGVALIASLAAPCAAHAQTDYFNTDGGRPLRVQDAISVEWRALELQFAPLRLERQSNKRWQVELEPELAFGILPRTHLSVGFPLATADRPIGPIPANGNTVLPFDNGRVTGLSGLHLSLFHQLNVETRIPALAVRGEVLLPVGPLGPDRAYPALTAIATRTLPALGAVRVHGNATVTFGDGPDDGQVTIGKAESAEVPRWMAGVSMDRAFPLKSTLIAAELVAHRSMIADDDVVFSSGVGVRHQFSPRLVFDVGVGRDISGPDANWSFTVGSAVALGLGRRLF